MAKKSISRKRSAAQRAIDTLGDYEERKIQRAKRITRRMVPLTPLTIRENSAKCATLCMIARLNHYSSDFDSTTFLAKVPMIITTVPEIPGVVVCEGNVYALQSTAPLTYAFVRTASAERVR